MAARSLGEGNGGTLRRLYLPLMRGSVASALLVVFVDCVKELPATLLLRPFNYNTLSTRVYELASLEKLGEAAPAALMVVASKSHRDAATDDYIRRYAVADVKSAGSSLKFCLIAEGRFDAYPRTGPTSEWDTAAGQAVLEAAGGRVMAEDGQPLRYGKPGFENPDFLAWGRPTDAAAAKS